MYIHVSREVCGYVTVNCVVKVTGLFRTTLLATSSYLIVELRFKNEFLTEKEKRTDINKGKTKRFEFDNVDGNQD